MKVLSIDIGVLNLALVLMEVSDDYSMFEILQFRLVDITNYTHTIISDKDCSLHHSKTFADWILHLIQEHPNYFTSVDKILLERQPPTGFVVVEQLLYLLFRDKTDLISPNSVHKYFNIGSYDYEGRKEQSIRLAKENCYSHQITCLEEMSRSHDIADAICQFVYWYDKNKLAYDKRCRHTQLENDFIQRTGSNLNDYLNKFKYSI